MYKFSFLTLTTIILTFFASPIIPQQQTFDDLHSLVENVSLLNVSQTAIEIHNSLRARHQVPPLKWDSDLAKLAQKVADNLIAKKSLSSSGMGSSPPPPDVGENVAGFSGQSVRIMNASQMTMNAILDWYRELANYRWEDPEKNWFHGVTHACQIIWQSTQSLGLALATDQISGMSVIVAEYKPRGNVEGLFEANVKRPIKLNQKNDGGFRELK